MITFGNVHSGPVRLERLLFENVEHGAAKVAVLKRRDKPRLFDNFAAGYIDDDGSLAEHCEPPGADQSIGFRNKWRRHHQHVATTKRVIQLIGPAMRSTNGGFADRHAGGRR